jgi:hypothetical protein
MRGFPFRRASPVHHENEFGWTRRVSDVREIRMVELCSVVWLVGGFRPVVEGAAGGGMTRGLAGLWCLCSDLSPAASRTWVPS